MASTGLDLSLTFGDPISIILGIVFIILGIIVLITAKGLLSNTSDDLQYSIFGRLEIMGIVDMLSVLILILIIVHAYGINLIFWGKNQCCQLKNFFSIYAFIFLKFFINSSIFFEF